jgi:hypothetical protein
VRGPGRARVSAGWRALVEAVGQNSVAQLLLIICHLAMRTIEGSVMRVLIGKGHSSAAGIVPETERPRPSTRVRHLGDLLGERLPRTVGRPTAPAPLAPLHHRELAPTRQVPRAGQHPVLPRRRTHPAHRTPRRVRIIGDQLHDLHPGRGEHDTLHRQPGQPQQTRHIIATVNHGPWLSSRCSKTQRGSRSHGPPSSMRAGHAQPQVARSRSKSR